MSRNKMISRERTRMTFRHEEPDRMPIDFGSGSTCGIMGVAYNRLKRYLGIDPGPTRIYNLQMQLAIPDNEVIERLRGDVVANDERFYAREWKPWKLTDGSDSLIPAHCNVQRRGEEWVVMDGDRIDMRMPEGCFYFEQGEPALADASISEIERWELPPLTDEQLEHLADQARLLYDGTDKCVKFTLRGSVYENSQTLRGWERFMYDLALDRPLVEALLDKLCEGYMRNFDQFHAAVDGRCDVIWVGDDLGTQKAPQINPDLYRELVFPRHRRLYQHIKSKGDYLIGLHCCGSIIPLLDHLIDAGVDAINPVQITADNMDPRELKERFGDRLVFWGGGVDTQRILQFGTPNEVAANVEELCAIFKPSGGFVWGTIHNIQATVPPENIVAAYEAAYRCAGY